MTTISPLHEIAEAKTSREKVTVAARRESSFVNEAVLQHVPGHVWDEEIAEFDGVCHEQLHDFAKNRWSKANYEPVLIYRKGKPVAGALMTVRRLPFALASVAVSKWGPILKDTSAENAADVYEEAVEALKKEYADKRRMMLILLPRAPRAPFDSAAQVLEKKGFTDGPQIFDAPDRYLVNVRLSDEELKKSLAQKWRYHLKKSMKNELEFERATPDQFGEFDKLYRIMISRKSFDDVSAYNDTINALMQSKSEYLRPEIFFVRHEGEIIAGALIFKAGDTPEYLYGATNDQALSLRAGYFLQWNIVRWLRENTQATWYDLGGTQNVQGLHQFKKGLAGSAGLITPIPPLATYTSHFWPRFVGDCAFKARDVAKRARQKIADLLKQGKPE